MHNVMEDLKRIGIIPVLQIEEEEDAVSVANALLEGGIPCAEITFRTKSAANSIRRIRSEVPGMLVGAGTVLTAGQADEAISAGAEFIVSPGLCTSVVRFCTEKGVAMIPGCATPTEIEAAMAQGIKTVKFFPAESCGGAAAVRSLAAPYQELQFIPTGGIRAENIGSYLDIPAVAACGSSALVRREWVAEQKFSEITRCARDMVRRMLDLHLAHVGVNTPAEGEIAKTAALFAEAFCVPTRPGTKSVFAGEVIEVMPPDSPGRMGHIAIGTADVLRAGSYLERRGFHPVWNEATHDASGRMKKLYLSDDFCGFAVHLFFVPRRPQTV